MVLQPATPCWNLPVTYCFAMMKENIAKTKNIAQTILTGSKPVKVNPMSQALGVAECIFVV
jgi:hypothetical protein